MHTHGLPLRTCVYLYATGHLLLAELDNVFEARGLDREVEFSYAHQGRSVFGIARCLHDAALAGKDHVTIYGLRRTTDIYMSANDHMRSACAAVLGLPVVDGETRPFTNGGV